MARNSEQSAVSMSIGCGSKGTKFSGLRKYVMVNFNKWYHLTERKFSCFACSKQLAKISKTQCKSSHHHQHAYLEPDEDSDFLSFTELMLELHPNGSWILILRCKILWYHPVLTMLPTFFYLSFLNDNYLEYSVLNSGHPVTMSQKLGLFSLEKRRVRGEDTK